MKQNNSKGHFRPRSNGRPNRGNSVYTNPNASLDSNGPCGKIKGTALQIMEKYLAAAKDAGGADDRVLYENCMQHAEHYFRIYMQATNMERERRQDDNVIPMEEPSEQPSSKHKQRRGFNKNNPEKQATEENVEEFNDNVIAMDLSFPDVSKLGKKNANEEEGKSDENMSTEPSIPAKRGRKPRAIKSVCASENQSGIEKEKNAVEGEAQSMPEIIESKNTTLRLREIGG